ncbi:MAG: histidinol dehydrogenase [Phycisphaeraceae bacterium]|nr:MAG: histidinol dehydrogenase [Phycisphaeraceae bacterium]
MTESARLLRRIAPAEVSRALRPPVDATTLAAAGEIVERVRAGGEQAVREYAQRFGERTPDQPLALARAEMRAALDNLDPAARAVLERTAERIRAFARAQRAGITEIDVPILGGRAGHTVEPVASAGCYAPAGRYPLPSTVLMTAVTARVAGCERVVVASPGAHPVMLAAGAIAEADAFLAVGGAHAIAALAHGFGAFARCDMIVGPGNKWVTAAKQLVVGVSGIDMLAGPSELLVLADDTADPATVATDLLAQAEHDTEAGPMLVTTSPGLADAVESALASQLEALPTRATAHPALANGFVCVASTLDEAIAVADAIAPEHLEIITRDPAAVASRLRNAGALFIGSSSAEVLGDYGAGPNHTLPTGGSARFQAGLSVATFLRLRSWMRIDDTAAARELVADAMALAQIEGLAGHRASAARRLSPE